MRFNSLILLVSSVCFIQCQKKEESPEVGPKSEQRTIPAGTAPVSKADVPPTEKVPPKPPVAEDLVGVPVLEQVGKNHDKRSLEDLLLSGELEGKTIRVKESENFGITLSECIGCSPEYQLAVKQIDEESIEFLNKSSVSRACQGCDGGSSDVTFHFRAKKVGTSIISIEHVRKKITFTIEIFK